MKPIGIFLEQIIALMSLKIIIAFLIAFPISSYADDQYENFVNNAYLISKNFSENNKNNAPNLAIFTS
jgi:hypothetical protein